MIASRYEVLGLLGSGGMGVVYRAQDRIIEDVVALKLLTAENLPPEMVRHLPEMAQRFRREIRLARRVTHRNVCRIHEYGEDGDTRYISMALVEGVDLKHLLKANGAFPAEVGFDTAIGIAEALEAIHDEGIVHRDLKTPNIMRDHRGVVKVMDFGIAKLLEAEGNTGVTGTGMIVGTPDYLSPEQGRAMPVDHRSDLYSLGIVIFELFTGHVPFHGGSPIDTILMHIQAPPPLDQPIAARLPLPLVPVLRRLLAKAPEDRYACAREVVEALREARRASVVSAPMAPLPGVTQEAAVARVRPSPVATPVPTPVPTPVLTPVPTVAAACVPTPSSPQSAVRVPLQRPSDPLQPTVGSIAPRRQRSDGREALMPVASEHRPLVIPIIGGIAAAAVLAAVVIALLASSRRTSPDRTIPPPTAALPSATPIAIEPPSTTTSLESKPLTPTMAPTPRVAITLRPTPGTPPTTEGFLQIVVVPWADVTVDGSSVSTASLRKIRLSPGLHVVRLVHPDYQPLQRQVSVRAGETVALTVDLPEEAVSKR